MEDDHWMHPATSFTWAPKPPKNGTFYEVQRKRATPVSGNVSHIYSWDWFADFPTKAERDEHLALLRQQHPTWHLRGRTVHYMNGQQMGGDPFEYRDD